MAPAIKTKKVEVQKDEESGVMKTETRSVEYLDHFLCSFSIL